MENVYLNGHKFVAPQNDAEADALFVAGYARALYCSAASSGKTLNFTLPRHSSVF